MVLEDNSFNILNNFSEIKYWALKPAALLGPLYHIMLEIHEFYYYSFRIEIDKWNEN